MYSKRGREKKQNILRAARELFGQFGLKKASVDDVAQAASVSKATIYKYFASKEEIFAAVVGAEGEEMMAAIRAAVDREETLEGKLRAHLLTKMNTIRDLVNFYRVTQGDWSGHWPDVASINESFLEAETDLVREILECGQNTGELEIGDTRFTAHVMTTALKSLEFPWSVESAGVSADEYVDRLLEIMLNGLRRRGGMGAQSVDDAGISGRSRPVQGGRRY